MTVQMNRNMEIFQKYRNASRCIDVQERTHAFQVMSKLEHRNIKNQLKNPVEKN